ncbi:MAG: hypothetical protein ACT4QA_16055 [Panacagrimonas sp.]
MNTPTKHPARPAVRGTGSQRLERLRNWVIDHLPSALAKVAIRLLLSLTPGLVHRAAENTPRLRELLGSGAFVVCIATMQGGGGQLHLRDGRLRFVADTSGEADITQTWVTPQEALRALTSSDETDLQRAFVAGHLKLRGSFLPMLWLNEALKLARRRDSKQITKFLSREAA